MKTGKKGFTLMEMLIVVAIIGILVAVAMPVFSAQLEKTRETTDLANARSAYAQVAVAAMVEDTTSPAYLGGTYQIFVNLQQKENGWSMDTNQLNVGGIRPGDPHWKGTPKAKGRCRVYCFEDEMYICWTDDHINEVTAQDFLTKDILEKVLGSNYGYTVVNSHETYAQGGGTQKFIDFAKQNGFDLTGDYGAVTWQIYAKGTGSNGILSKPAIYWSTVDVKDITVDKTKPVYVPVIGYRDGKYDVYSAKVVAYNVGTANQYNSLENNFAKVTEAGGSATFQFDRYEDALDAYNKLLTSYDKNGTISDSDLKNNHLKD